MKKYAKFLSVLILSLLITSMLPLSVYANSSWRWISETRPYDILPFAIVLTLAIEIFGIQFIAKTNKTMKLSISVIVANILSFISPYLLTLIFPSEIYSFSQMLAHTPFYTVGITYLVLTLLVEVPVVYMFTKENVQNKRKLFLSIAGINIATTIIVAIIERLICYGIW